MSALSRRRPLPQIAQPFHFQCPAGGINTVLPATVLPPEFCLRAYNLVPSEYGLRSRLGYTEWCTGMTGAADNYVRSVLTFTGSASGGTKDRVFGVTSTGIYDCTSSSVSPTLKYTFGTHTGEAGYGVFTTYVSAAGAHYLIYCDEVNGALIYTESTDTWTVLNCTGVAAGSLVAVAAFKDRLWFAEKDSPRAWYFATAGAISGALTQFSLGMKFRAGGDLVGMYSFTIDGGGGTDDLLVLLSRGGDVVIYQGTDPTALSTFGIKGVWYVGQLPHGRNVATDFGGDTLILTRGGAIPLSTLMSGGAGLRPEQYLTANVANEFNRLSSTAWGIPGWSMRIHPSDNTLIVTLPTTAGAATEQLVMALPTKGWTRYRDLPIYSSGVLAGDFYFGTTDGRICKNTGYIDDVLLSDPNSYSAIQWAMLTRFENLGNGLQKQIQQIRPTILCDGGTPTYRAEARYKYDFTEVGTVTSGALSGNVWDAGLWDTATWSGEYAATQAATGATGIGQEFAVALRGTAKARTIIVGIDVQVTLGGFL